MARARYRVAARRGSTYRARVRPSGTTEAIPFLDLRSAHAPIAQAILEDIESLLETSAFTNGPQVAEFERAFAEYCGTTDCIGVASGLDGLRLALVALGLERGDEVIVPAETFVATFEAVTQAGGVPVVVDVREDDYCLDPNVLESALTERTRFVMPVHLYGQVADMRGIEEICTRRDLTVLADACQAHGASRDGTGAAGAAAAAAFSFYPGKNLGAIGDAGALTTNDAELATGMRALREHGQTAKYHHDYEGWTARLDTIQAIALLHKLPLLDGWNAARRDAAGWYGEALAGVGDLRLPPVAPGSEPVWHLYVVRTSDPTALADFLRAREVATGRHYPEPPHLSPAYESLGHREGAFPVAETISRECLSLPMFPGLSQVQVERVAAAITEYFDG
jgi:dTDP-4-amino-4,6-dideoxygalactose transaminase